MSEKATVYPMGDFRNAHPLPSRDKIKSSKDTQDNPLGGGEAMEKQYATKEELKTLETKIDGKFETLDATLTGNFKTAKAETESQFSKLEARQTKWFIGTAIAVISIVVALIKLI